MSHQSNDLYLIRCQGLYKIGSAADVNRRLRQLRVASPFPMELMHTITCYPSGGPSPECQMHARFRDRRKVGEWFALAPEDVSWIREIEHFEDGRFWTWAEVIGPFATVRR